MERKRPPIWIFGVQGQLGFHLAEQWGSTAVGFTRADLDFEKENWLSRLDHQLRAGRPAYVLNATAYNQVDRAETDQKNCWRLNVEVPEQLALWCRAQDLPFVHYSTDYVFSGEGEREWREEDPPSPLNSYGRSKWEGEKAVLSAHPGALVIRTSWVYSHRRANFILGVLERARQGQPLQMVTNQIGRPTWASSLAEWTLKVMAKSGSGLLHICDGGEHVSRFELAKAALEMASDFEPALKNVEVKPIDDFPTPAKRPTNSRLSLAKLKSWTGEEPRSWKDNLRACLERYYESR